MTRIVISAILVILLSGCISTQQMDQQFYDGIEQGAQEYSEALGDVATYIGMYEGDQDLLQYEEWQKAILGASIDLRTLKRTNQI